MKLSSRQVIDENYNCECGHGDKVGIIKIYNENLEIGIVANNILKIELSEYGSLRVIYETLCIDISIGNIANSDTLDFLIGRIREGMLNNSFKGKLIDIVRRGSVEIIRNDRVGAIMLSNKEVRLYHRGGVLMYARNEVDVRDIIENNYYIDYEIYIPNFRCYKLT